MVRRRERTLFSQRSSWARAKLSSVTRAGTGISIHSSRGRSWPAVVLGVVTPRRRCGRITRVRAEMRVLPKQAAPRYAELRSTAQTVERSPARACLASRDAFSIDPPRDLTDAESLDCVHLIDAPHYAGLGFIDDVSGGCLVGLADVTVAVRSVAHHADLARLRPVSLAAARALQDLRSLIFSDHALELNQELIFCAVALWRLHKHRLDSMASEFLDQQNLVRVLAAQAVWRIREHSLDLPFSGKVPHALQAWPLQRRSAIAFIFEDPLSGRLQIVAPGELDQRCRLAGNRILLALLRGRNPGIDCRHPHHRTPSRARRRGARDMEPECRKPARASARASDPTNRKRGFEMGRFFDAAQPCLFRARRNAFNAPATIAPMVRPLLLAYFRSSTTVRGGSFNVTGTVASGTSTG